MQLESEVGSAGGGKSTYVLFACEAGCDFWANKVPRPLRGDVGRRAYCDAKSVLLLHSNQVGVGDATGAFTGSQRSRQTQLHAQSARSQTVINAQTKVDSAGSDHHSPRGKCSTNSQAAEISMSAVRGMEMRGQEGPPRLACAQQRARGGGVFDVALERRSYVTQYSHDRK